MNTLIRNICLTFGVLSLSGCTTELYIADVAFETKTSVSHKYAKYSGHTNYSINVDDGYSISVEITTKSGMIDITITNGEQTPYEGHIANDASFVVNVDPGHYTIKLNGNNHAGSYSFNWGFEQR